MKQEQDTARGRPMNGDKWSGGPGTDGEKQMMEDTHKDEEAKESSTTTKPDWWLKTNELCSKFLLISLPRIQGLRRSLRLLTFSKVLLTSQQFESTSLRISYGKYRQIKALSFSGKHMLGSNEQAGCWKASFQKTISWRKYHSFWPAFPICTGMVVNNSMHQMTHTTLFEPQLSWPDMDLRTAYGNMFLTTAYVKPYALLTKPKESLTTWWNYFQPNTKQVKGNLERCSNELEDNGRQMNWEADGKRQMMGAKWKQREDIRTAGHHEP